MKDTLQIHYQDIALILQDEVSSPHTDAQTD